MAYSGLMIAQLLPRPWHRPPHFRLAQIFFLAKTWTASGIITQNRDLGRAERQGQLVFIVQGKPREPEGIVKVTKATREDALQAANDFLNQGMPFVTIVADGRVYTVEEFALTIINGED